MMRASTARSEEGQQTGAASERGWEGGKRGFDDLQQGFPREKWRSSQVTRTPSQRGRPALRTPPRSRAIAACCPAAHDDTARRHEHAPDLACWCTAPVAASLTVTELASILASEWADCSCMAEP